MGAFNKKVKTMKKNTETNLTWTFIKATFQLVCGIYLILYFTGLGRSSNSSHVGSVDVEDEWTKDSLEIIKDDWCYIEEFDSRGVCGIVSNKTDKTVRFATVRISLYDASGVQVGSTLDNVENLEPHGKYKFKAPVIEEDAVKYKILRIEEH